MAKKLGLFKRIKLYRHYRRLLRNNEEIISSPKFNLRVDYVGRLYTVVNLPPDVKTYGTEIAQRYINEYVTEVDKMFQSIGVSEYVGILDIQQETEMDYVIVFGFKFIDTAKVANRLLLTALAIPIVWILISLIF
jgi:hypothetical protein